MSRTLSTAEAARITGLSEAQVRCIARSGLCRPGRLSRRYAFAFQDLVVLRAARALIESGVAPGRTARVLADLASALPAERALSTVRVYAEGRRVAVRDEAGAWEPETGQVLLDFDVAALAEATDSPQPVHTGDPDESPFDRALELEESDPKAAGEAYREFLEAFPEHIDAHINLGRLCHEAGDLEGAEVLYREAMELCPDDPVVLFNLALVLEDARRLEEAVTCYRDVLEIDPDFSDAHYNLASLFEELKRPSEALRHYRDYQRLRDRE
ncbi:MAG: tetratricopeptide repeat protein [Myxococcales bacterium]|nr:tetratricopeptide repeat protein [Myxococcales bacterium]